MNEHLIRKRNECRAACRRPEGLAPKYAKYAKSEREAHIPQPHASRSRIPHPAPKFPQNPRLVGKFYTQNQIKRVAGIARATLFSMLNMELDSQVWLMKQKKQSNTAISI